MAITRNKKGVFFTFIAILLIMTLMIAFRPQTELRFEKSEPAIKVRVTRINEFVTDFENVYMPNIMRSTCYNALTLLIDHMNTQNKFIADLEPTFEELILHGTIDNNPVSQMNNNTLLNWTTRMETVAEKSLGIDFNFTQPTVNINQSTPWFVDIELKISYSVSSETANWSRNNILIRSKLAIDNFIDPLYYISTNGNYIKIINQTNIKFDEWNTSNLKKFIEEGTYFHWPDSNASNFLMRFTNTSSPSHCCGIESAVDPNKIAPQAQVESYIDYLFFSHKYQNQCAELYNISGVFPEYLHFKLDFNNLIKYNVSKDDAELTC